MTKIFFTYIALLFLTLVNGWLVWEADQARKQTQTVLGYCQAYLAEIYDPNNGLAASYKESIFKYKEVVDEAVKRGYASFQWVDIGNHMSEERLVWTNTPVGFMPLTNQFH